MSLIRATRALSVETWQEIRKKAEEGSIRSRERFLVNLKNREKAEFTAAHDVKTGKLFFVLDDCLKEEAPMNRERTNKGGWAASDMRVHLNTTVFKLLPDDLQEVIVPTSIVQIVDGERVESQDKLFLLSKTQVFGECRESEFEPEDAQLDIFLREKDRVKECGDHGTWFWWLRSPLASSSSSFCGVNGIGSSPTGIAAGYAAPTSAGVAFGFSLT